MFVCLGNTCRSPMAEALLRHKLAQQGLDDAFVVNSAGTTAYRPGEPPHPITQAVLQGHGVPVVGTARGLVAADFSRFDLLLAMDRLNLSDLRAQCPAGEHHRLHLVLEPTTGGEVPDPFDGAVEEYERVFALLDGALDGWMERWGAG